MCVRLYFLLWIPIALIFWGLIVRFITAGQIDIASLRFRLVEYVFGLVLEHFRVRLQYLMKRLSLLGFSTLISIFEGTIEIWLLGRICFNWDHKRRWVIILKVILVLICKRLVRISWSKAFVQKSAFIKIWARLTVIYVSQGLEIVKIVYFAKWIVLHLIVYEKFLNLRLLLHSLLI